MFFHMAGGAQAKMSTWFSKPNQSLISKVIDIFPKRLTHGVGPKMPIFRKKPWVNPLGKMSIFRLFGLPVFIG